MNISTIVSDALTEIAGQRPFYQHPHFYKYVAGLGTLSGIYYFSHLETVPMSGRSRFMNVSKDLERQSGELGFKEIMQEYGRSVLPEYHPTVRSVTQVALNLIKGILQYRLVHATKPMI